VSAPAERGISLQGLCGVTLTPRNPVFYVYQAKSSLLIAQYYEFRFNYTMSTTSMLIWVNKTPDSSSLSNCRSEKENFRQIRSHAVAVGHRSSRIKRPIKRTPFDLKWSQRGALASSPDTSSLRSSSQALGDNNLRSQVAHRYAAKAMQGLQQQMQDQKEWEEEEATEALLQDKNVCASRPDVSREQRRLCSGSAHPRLLVGASNPYPTSLAKWPPPGM
jgi:hypothetical protein